MWSGLGRAAMPGGDLLGLVSHQVDIGIWVLGLSNVVQYMYLTGMLTLANPHLGELPPWSLTAFAQRGVQGGAVPHIRLAGRLGFSTQILCARQPKSRPAGGFDNFSFDWPNTFSTKPHLRPDLVPFCTRLLQLFPKRPDSLQVNMAGNGMEIEVAEKQLKSLEHSEQHYFNRQVARSQLGGHTPMLTSALQL